MMEPTTMGTESAPPSFNYFASQRLGYRTDNEIASLPTSSSTTIDVQPRKDAYQRLMIFFVATFCALAFDRLLSFVNVHNKVLEMVVGILGILLCFPMLYFGWQTMHREHQLMQRLSALEQDTNAHFFPVQQETFERSLRLVLLRGFPILLVLVLFWESRIGGRTSTTSTSSVMNWIIMTAAVLVYGVDLLCLEWYRHKALQQEQQPAAGASSDESFNSKSQEATSAASPSPLLGAHVV